MAVLLLLLAAVVLLIVGLCLLSFWTQYYGIPASTNVPAIGMRGL
jgi:hypothetical protein